MCINKYFSLKPWFTPYTAIEPANDQNKYYASLTQCNVSLEKYEKKKLYFGL